MGRGGDGNGQFLEQLFKLAQEDDDGQEWRRLALSLKQERKDRPFVGRLESLLEVAQAMRHAGVLGTEEAHFAIAMPILMIAERRIEDPNSSPALESLSKRMEAIEREHGLTSDEYWEKGEAPEDYEALNQEYERVIDEIIASTFDEYGERDLGSMYRHDRQRFDQLHEAGRKKYFGRTKGSRKLKGV